MVANSHYRALPSDHEHLYANLATSWNSPHGLGLARAPAPSLPRFGSPVQRPFAAHYLDYAGPSEYLNHQPPSQLTWHANYLRPASHEWTHPVSEGSYTARPLPYVDDEARAPVPHASPPARQHQDASDAARLLPYNAPAPVYHSGEHQHRTQHPSEQAPPFPPQAPNLAPVARLLNYPTTGLHVGPPHEPSQAPISWPAASSSNVSPEYPPCHTSTTLSSDAVLAGPGQLRSLAWDMLNTESSTNTPPVYEQVPHPEPDWQSLAAMQLQQHASAPQIPHAEGTRRGGRKAAPKTSLAKVPATFNRRQPKLKISKRQGPLPEAQRQKAHKMRKEKATCSRCRTYKTGCDGGDPCKRCLKIEGNARSFRLPCTRDRLEDANLVRRCNGRSNQEEGEFFGYDWLRGSQLYSMDISWNLPMYGPISNNAPPMRVTFREYYPNRQLLDTTVSMWTNNDGVVKVIEQPAYAIYDTANLMSTFERYFSSMQPAIEAWIFDRVRGDPIALLTYNEVIRVRGQKPSGPRNLLDLVMAIQCLSVVSQGYGSIVTQNIPGIQEYDYAKMGRSTYEAYDRNSCDRPLTNAINHQMDVAALKYLKKLEKLCVKELSSQIFKSKIKPWYEIFLALYVLYWNMEYIHHGAERYIIAKNGTAVQQQVSSVVSNQLKKWDWAFKVLTHHWMAVLRDFYPFKLARENPEELRVNGHLDAEGFEYVMRVVSIFDSIGFGRSTTPYVGQPSTHDSLSSEWIKALFEKAFGV